MGFRLDYWTIAVLPFRDISNEMTGFWCRKTHFLWLDATVCIATAHRNGKGVLMVKDNHLVKSLISIDCYNYQIFGLCKKYDRECFLL